MQLFEKNFKNKAPLADRIRPKNLEEIVGQKDLIGKDKILRKMVESKELFSMIFWGPPGSGKTTLARVIASQIDAHFIQFSAVASGVEDIRKVISGAELRLKNFAKRTILFVDELHRFNKAQQDYFLPYVENGTIILIGATTENPSFEVISPLLSRCKVFVLKALSPEDLKIIIKKALKDKERGLGNFKTEIDEEALDFLIFNSNGDARIALNALEIATLTTKEKEGKRKITKEIIEEVLQKRILYDKAGEEHYNVISAFIKSLRGSDSDAALYYLARMLEAGEDPEFIARRLIIFSSEDIGNVDPLALPIAISCFEAVRYVGLPECEINLAQTTTYLASASKSNASYLALIRAKEDVKNFLNLPIPLHLRNAPTKFMEKLGYGKGYKYPHNYKNTKVKQDYLPEKLKGRKYYLEKSNHESSRIKPD